MKIPLFAFMLKGSSAIVQRHYPATAQTIPDIPQERVFVWVILVVSMNLPCRVTFSSTVLQTPLCTLFLQLNADLDIINLNETDGNIRLGWDRKFSERSSLMLQTYYDRVHHQVAPMTKYAESFDAELQHRFPLLDRHDLTWGLNYRLFNTDTLNTLITSFVPQEASNYFVSGFIRDEVSVLPDKLKFSLGVRLSYNNFSGVEVQLNVRIMWTPDTQNFLWVSISLAVRIPARGEQDVIINYGLIPPQPGFTGSPLPIMQAYTWVQSFQFGKTDCLRTRHD